MLRKSFRGWKIKQETQNLTAIRTPSPRLNPVRESPGSPTRPAPLTSLSPLPALFSYCQENLPPTSPFRFSLQTSRFPLCTGPVATGFSAAAYYCRAPEPEPSSPDDFTHVEYPNSNVKSLRESSVGVDDGREDDGEGLGRRRTLPEELSSTVVVLTCMSKDVCKDGGSCDVFLLGQGLRRELPIVSCSKSEEPYLHIWDLDVDMLESLMRNSKDQFDFISISGWSLLVDPTGVLYDRAFTKAVVNRLEVCRGHELRVAFEEAIKYGGGKVANKLEGYPGCEFRVADDDYAPSDDLSQMSLQEKTKAFVSFFHALLDDEDDKTVESFDQEMSKESPTIMKTIAHERD